MKDKPGFIPAHGNCRELLSIERPKLFMILLIDSVSGFLPGWTPPLIRWSKRPDLGKQNIIEGSKVSGASKEMEIKLLGVARASLVELLVDYWDFLRVRALS